LRLAAINIAPLLETANSSAASSIQRRSLARPQSPRAGVCIRTR
jgi:hypothetical protein